MTAKLRKFLCLCLCGAATPLCSAQADVLDFILSSPTTAPLTDLIGSPTTDPLDFVISSQTPDPLTDLIGSVSPSPQPSSQSTPPLINSSLLPITSPTSSLDFLISSQSTSPLHPSSLILNTSPITSGFGYRPKFGRMHRGVDIAMPVGSLIRSVLPGVVERVGVEPRGYGLYVVVRHADGMETRYAHLSESLVEAGQQVARDQEIALSGNSGNSTSPHLHFETRQGGTPVDPTTLFDFSGGAIRHYKDFINTSTNQTIQMIPGSSTDLQSRSTYVVKAGDTLQDIATRSGIPTMRLCQLNMITENAPLEIGRMLKLR